MNLNFTPINQNEWPRREQFYYFNNMAPTAYSLTVEIDITKLLTETRKNNIKFFPVYLWLVTKCLNEQIEFRIAIKDGAIGYYDCLTPLYAAFHDDDKTFSMMWTPYCDSFSEFYKAYLDNQKRYGDNHGILAQKHCLPPPNAYTVSCIPWLSFNHFAVHSYDNKPYYFPSVEAAKYYVDRNGKTLLPLSVTVHHATTDGYHISKFIERLQKEADTFHP